jgi:exodeoxyribonuclease V alpha subunit
MYNFTEMPFYPQADDDEAALDAVIDQYNDERIDCPDVTKIALISPVRKGILGVSNLNMTLQDIVCPASMNNAAGYNSNHKRNYHANKGYQIMSTIYGNSERYTRFRVGDTVMCTKNNSCIETFKYKNDDYWNGSPESTEMGIFNGDQGKIIGYIEAKDSNDEHEIIVIQFFNNMIAEIDLTAGDFDSFELGYAMTVHKAQGCEYDTVVYVSPKSLTGMTSGGFATKNLVYTAVTRAKKRVVIMGSKESLNNCIMTNAVERHSNLAERMK